MRAEILAVGSELLTPLRSDTNALWLTERLIEVGVEVGARTTVADDPALLESAFRTAWSRAEIVISTGGLGPTEDDLTREAAAAALGRGLRHDPDILEALKARFAKYKRPMAAINEKQADVIDAYDAELARVQRELALLQPPAVMRSAFVTQQRTFTATRRAGAVLAATLRKSNRSRVSVAGRRFTIATRGAASVAAQQLQIASVKAYNARVRAIGAIQASIQAEVARLQQAPN